MCKSKSIFKISFILEATETALILTADQLTQLNNALSDAETFTGHPYTQLIQQVKTINPGHQSQKSKLSQTIKP